MVNRRQGRVSGSFVGLRIANAFEPLTPLIRALLVGGLDGLTFGAVFGSLVGFGLAWDGHHEWTRMRLAFGCGLALVVMATVFGLISQELGTREKAAVLSLSGGGIVGVIAGFVLGGADGLMIGALMGLLIGAVLGVRLATR